MGYLKDMMKSLLGKVEFFESDLYQLVRAAEDIDAPSFVKWTAEPLTVVKSNHDEAIGMIRGTTYCPQGTYFWILRRPTSVVDQLNRLFQEAEKRFEEGGLEPPGADATPPDR